MLSISQAVVRISDGEYHLPQIEKLTGDYVISHNNIGDVIWTCAVPSEISDSLVEMCRINGIRAGRIHAIDTLEYRMACYLSKKYLEPCCLIIPQEPGIRLVTLQNGVVLGCYFFSNDVNFRERELKRIWLSQRAAPRIAVVGSAAVGSGGGAGSDGAAVPDGTVVSSGVVVSGAAAVLGDAVVSGDSGYLWLLRFLDERAVTVQDIDSTKREMIEDWIKT